MVLCAFVAFYQYDYAEFEHYDYNKEQKLKLVTVLNFKIAAKASNSKM